MSNLLIIHLVDSRKSRVEMQEYINKATEESEKLRYLPNKITNCFAFGGDTNFSIFKDEIKLPPDCLVAVENEEFKCSSAIRNYIESIMFHVDISERTSTYFNIRDMDDEYDTEMMVKDLPHEDDNVGIVRYNYKVDSKESTYGRFKGDYFIKSWVDVGPSRTEHPKDIFEAIVNEPHMIHRPFALFRADVLAKYIDTEGTVYPSINKAEDYQIMAATYVICLAELHLGIKVCGSVNIANYIRSAGQMSQGDCDWTLREEEFHNNISMSAQAILDNYDYKNDILNKMVSAFLHVTVAERCIGNIKSMVYHLNQEGKLNGI